MKNRNGFTMIELLATITILGILSIVAITSVNFLIKKGKSDYLVTQRSNLINAAKSFYQNNRSRLPKTIGEKDSVSYGELKNGKYIGKLYADDKTTECDVDNTKVVVLKKDKTNYKYKSYLSCGSLSENEKEGDDTTITATYVKNNNSIVLVLESSNTKIVGYSYEVLKNGYTYISRISEKVSGMTVNTKPFIINLADYKKDNTFEAVVKVVCESGKSYTKKVIIDSGDNLPPKVCNLNTDVITDVTEWTNKPQTIKIKCHDNDSGDAKTTYVSGCEKDEYNLTIKNSADARKYKIVKLKDKAGNSSDCDISSIIKVDTEAPVITFTTDRDGYDLYVNVKDDQSGIVKHNWQNETVITTNPVFEVNNSKSGGTSDGANISYYATDKAGNSGSNAHARYKWCSKTDYNGILPSWDVVKAAKNQSVWNGVPIFRWTYKSRNCSKNRTNGPVRKYTFEEYGCQCNLDRYSRRFCSYSNYGNYTTATHPNQTAKIYYQKNDYGESACNGDINVNSYVTQVCDTGKTSAIPLFFHGYYFYQGAVGPYNNFNPSNYWFTWTLNDPGNRISSSSSIADACAHGCKLVYGTN